MFDGDRYHGECWDPQHGHAVPAGWEEHVQANPAWRGWSTRNIRTFSSRCRLSGRGPHSPHSYYWARPGLRTAGSRALGYRFGLGLRVHVGAHGRPAERAGPSPLLLHLAYGLPLYIHIDLRTDNANALVFWWNASTCRHLGIGGTHQDPAAQKAHHEAMANYRRLGILLQGGHVLRAGRNGACPRASLRTSGGRQLLQPGRSPDPPQTGNRSAKFGLDASRKYEIKGAPPTREKRYVVDVEIPSHGHILSKCGNQREGRNRVMVYVR